MAGSTLDPDNIPGRPRPKTQKGHDVKSLGPSDTSDSGSDMAGPGLLDDDVLPLDRGTNEDPEAGKGGKIEAGGSGGGRGEGGTNEKEGGGGELTPRQEARGTSQQKHRAA